MKRIIERTNFPGLIPHAITIMIVAIMLVVNQAVANPEQISVAEALNSGVLTYQGTLIDSSGNPVSNSYDMTFRMYNSLTSTTALWEEMHSGVNAVPVQNGLFHILLGSLNPIPSTVWEEVELYLGVKIGDDVEMVPREKLTIVPGAAVANVAKMAFTVPDDSITGAKIIDGSLTQTDAPTLIRGAGEGEIIRHDWPVFYTGSDENGVIVVSYPCFPNGVWAFVATNAHYEANHSIVVGNNLPGRCETTVYVSPPTTNPIRIQWIAIGN